MSNTNSKLLWNKAINLVVGGCGLLSKRPTRYNSSNWPSYYKTAKGIKIKSIESPVCKLLAKVICDPEIVKLDPGFWIIEFKEQITWFALCGANATPPFNKL